MFTPRPPETNAEDEKLSPPPSPPTNEEAPLLTDEHRRKSKKPAKKQAKPPHASIGISSGSGLELSHPASDSFESKSQSPLFKQEEEKKQQPFSLKLRHLALRDPLVMRQMLKRSYNSLSQPFKEEADEKKQHFLDETSHSLKEIAAEKALSVTRFIKGVESITEKLWPVALFSLLAHDLAKLWLASAEDQYGNNFWRTLSGQSTNEYAWSSHLGSDHPGTSLYWIAPIGLLIFPSFVGLLLSRYFSPAVRELDPYLIKQHLQTVSPGSYCNDLSVTLDDAEFLILWDARRTFEEQDSLLEVINKKTKDHNWLIHWKARTKIANIAGGFQDEDIKLLEKVYRNSRLDEKEIEEKVKKLEKLKLKALDYLVAHSKETYHGQYLLWTIEPSGSYLRNTPFYISKACEFYAKLRMWQIIFQKLIEAAIYVGEKYSCTNADKVFSCLTQIEECLCALCSDWAQDNPNMPSVYYADMDSSQGCLNALLAKSQLPKTILSAIDRFIRYPDFTIVDLSQQNMGNWNDADWDAFFTKLENIMQGRAEQALEIFNFSRPAFTPPGPSSVLVRRLAEFFQRVKIRKIDLRNQYIDPENMQQLVRGFNNTPTEYLDLSGNRMGDAGLHHVASALPHMPKLRTLKLADNEATDEGAIILAQAVEQSTITALDVSGNSLQSDGISALVATAETGTLHSFDISGMPLSLTSFRAIGPRLPFLRSLRAASAHISDAHIIIITPYLQHARTQRWEFPDNQIGDMGIRLFVSNLRNDTSVVINVNYNRITDTGLIDVSTLFAEKIIDTFEIAGNRFTEYGFAVFTQKIVHTMLRVLNIGDNELGDTSAEMLAKAITTVTNLRHLDVSNIKMTTKGGLSLFRALTKTNITDFIAAGNSLSSSVIINANTSYANLWKLDLSHTQIDYRAIDVLANKLPDIALRILVLNGNIAIGDRGGMKLAQCLLRNVPHLTNMGDKAIPRDLKRWLNHRAERNTTMVEIRLANTNVSAQTARAFYRGAKPADMAIRNLHLEDNPIDPREVNIETGQISGGSRRAEPSQIFRWLRESTQLFSYWKLPTHPVVSSRIGHLQENLANAFHVSLQGGAAIIASTGLTAGDGHSHLAHSSMTFVPRPSSENTSLKLVLFLTIASGALLIYLLSRVLNTRQREQDEFSERVSMLVGYQQFGLMRAKRTLPLPAINIEKQQRKAI